MNKSWKNKSLDGTWKMFFIENKDYKKISKSISTISDLEQLEIKSISAKVPGNFEIDMQNSGLLGDLFKGENSLEAKKLENLHLWYCLEFENSDYSLDRSYFNFEGIDTFSEVFLNGIKILNTDNMLIPYEVKCKGIRKGKNELVVHISPVLLKARQNIFEAGITQHQRYNSDSITVRKAPHMFGWDIMPRILSGGIWRSVYLFEKPLTYIDKVYFSTISADDKLGMLHFYYRTVIDDDFIDDYHLVVTGECGENKFSTDRKLWHTEARTFIHIDNPKLWWPKGMGEPNLYDIMIKLCKKDEVIDVFSLKEGIRTVHLERTDVIEENGDGEFCFYVNGEKMFVRGMNWVPLDPFHSRDKERLEKALEFVDDINCNMVRCWGGNVYESDEFFDFCDEKGIAVWQDFAMACSSYPQSDEFKSAIRNEAEVIVKRLRNHTSLFIWVGDNECDIAINGWHPIRQNPNFNKLTREVLPEVIRNFDPFREYMPSSPYISQVAFERHMEKKVPEYHLWGPRIYYKSEYYSNAVCRFASETGYHGCPSVESLKNFLNEDKLWPWQDNNEWLIHGTNVEKSKGAAYANRIPVMDNQIFALFGFHPDNIETFARFSQITQSEANKYFVERFRLGKWNKTTGILLWNLLDGWPQFSDALVDYYYNKKLSYETIKRVFEPVCVMIREPKDGYLTVACANDTLKTTNVSYQIIDISTNEVVVKDLAKIPANQTVDIDKIPYYDIKTAFYKIEFTVNGKKLVNHYLFGNTPIDKDLCVKGYESIGLL